MPLDLQTYTEYIDVKVSAVHASNSTPKWNYLVEDIFGDQLNVYKKEEKNKNNWVGGREGGGQN